jgi:hypothetical protein
MMRRSHPFTIILTAALVAAAVSCRDSQPSAVISPASFNHLAPSEDAGNGAVQLVACPAHGTLTASAIVGSSGGVIRLGGDQLVIPGGALDESTLITATIPADTLADIAFEPQGLQFQKPAILVLSTAGCNVGNSAPQHVVYLDADGQVLQTLDATPAQGGNGVAAKIGHFSSYAVAF